ncbi:MAG: PBP1A family penicillin-binding protein, partial [Actinomycetota bacterium]|nr:PBP1A family penicillin-binding protein [Actinomycetota bacterium]
MRDQGLRIRRALASALTLVAIAAGCSYDSRSILPVVPVGAQSSTLLAADGTVVTTFHAEENRRVVPLEEIPRRLQDAVIAIEDERFYRHKGVDLRAIMRAVRTNTEEGTVAQGGSTITQQYVKKVLLGNDAQTIERKLSEASMAVQLERTYSKERILELYLNAIYFGNGAYGVDAAARQYFGKQLGDLSLAESALLAGLIQRPSATDPYDHPHLAVARRDVVLDQMVKYHYATAEEAAAAKNEPLALGSSTTPAAERYPAAYFVESVKQWILHDERFGATATERRDLLFGGGIRIHTTVDLEAQAEAEAAMNEVLPRAGVDPDVALVAMEPGTGYIRAMVGGRDFFGNGERAKLNLATQGTGRQAGSSFKPVVLAAALADGMPVSTTYPAPACVSIPLPGQPTWKPCNYAESGAGGAVNLVEATVRSINTVYAQLIMDVGIEESMDMARALGVRSKLNNVASSVLGSNEVSAVDMATVYATFANRGVHVPPVLVTRITRPDGTVLYQHRHVQDRVLDVDVADTLTSILEQGVQRGTGTAARLDRPVAGKTGTADEWTNAWFAGYTPQLATAVWVGFAEGQIEMVPPRTAIKVTGGSYPAQIWKAFMADALADEPVERFPVPSTTTTSTSSTIASSTTVGLGLPGLPTPSMPGTSTSLPRQPTQPVDPNAPGITVPNVVGM